MALVVGGLLHDLAVDLVPDRLELVAVHQDRVDAVDLVLVLQEGQVAHVAHDAGEALQRHLVDVRGLQSEQGVL